jgi:hypothetical protein
MGFDRSASPLLLLEMAEKLSLLIHHQVATATNAAVGTVASLGNYPGEVLTEALEEGAVVAGVDGDRNNQKLQI